MTNQVKALVMVALVSACGGPSGEPVSASAGTSAESPRGMGATPSPSAMDSAKGPADEHGVRFAGGETSESGSASSAPPQCRFDKTIELGIEQAKGAGIAAIDSGLAILERQYEAAFHSGVCDEDCRANGAASEDTRIRVHAEPLAVSRTLRQPIPGMASADDCPDIVAYRTVVSIATDDGGASGRFYARFEQYAEAGEARLAAASTPDLRNFDGTWSVPVVLERPYWAALLTTLSLSESGTSGSLSVVFNYTDNDVGSRQGASPSTGDGEVGVGGVWPARAPAQVPVPSQPMVPGPVGAQPVSLTDFRTSSVIATCSVILTVFVEGPTEDPGNDFQHVDTDIRIDGRSHSWEDPPLPGASNAMSATVGGPPVPWEMGRVSAGALLEVDVRSTTANGVPYAGIFVSPVSVTSRCAEPGCVAHVEHRVTEYCDN